MTCELFHDNFQNYKRYNIPHKAQLVIADIPYNIGVDAYASNNKFKNCLITLSTNNPDLIRRGVVGKYDDFDVVMSNNLVKDEQYAYCDIRGKKAIAFAGQINEVEALRHPFRFKDIIRGLDTFGAKIIDEDRIQVVKIPLEAPAA